MMADDMGFSDLGCYGAEIATPNLDRLAAGGLRFTQFYNTARCCPTRAALLTGLYQHQAGIGAMVGNGGTPAYQGYLNDHCLTIAEVMKTAGYRTYMAGKWHVGEDRPHWPCDRGFDRYFGLISGASNYFVLDKGRKMARDNEPFVPDDPKFYMTDAFADAAVDFINDHGKSEQPFFMYVAFTAPHWPLHAWPQDIAKYRGKYMIGWDGLREQRHRRMIEMGLVDGSWPLTPRDPRVPAWADTTNKEDWDLRMAVYAAQIDRMDQNVGRILEALHRTGADEKTLILFLADNGGCAEVVDRGSPGVPPGPKESFASYGIGWANASNTPFRLYKHFVHEGGISTPLIAYWPGVIKSGGQPCRQVGHVIDLMATCVDVAGATYPTTYQGRAITPLEGRSLAPAFEGKVRSPHQAIYWEHERNRAVRQGNWKLVARAQQPWELFDVEADRTEMHNLAAQQPDRVREMSKLYHAWAARVGVKDWPDPDSRGDSATAASRPARRNRRNR
ncbi:MAG: arylsulfatase [Planctomycetes bacterium]|nr:arylsulfatase [Planctomycetota bacterium]